MLGALSVLSKMIWGSCFPEDDVLSPEPGRTTLTIQGGQASCPASEISDLRAFLEHLASGPAQGLCAFTAVPENVFHFTMDSDDFGYFLEAEKKVPLSEFRTIYEKALARERDAGGVLRCSLGNGACLILASADTPYPVSSFDQAQDKPVLG